MLNFTDISIRRGTRVLFEKATFNLYRGEKIGITGENAIEADWLAVAESLHG